MKVENIQSVEDMQNYCDGIINDLMEGIIDRREALNLLGEYSVHIVELSHGAALKKVSEITDKLL